MGIVLILNLIALDSPIVSVMLFGTYAASGPVYWLWRKRTIRPRQDHAG